MWKYEKSNWKYTEVYNFWVNMNAYSHVQLDCDDENEVYSVKIYDNIGNFLVLNNSCNRNEMQKWMINWMQN
jgi:hypothetical protein